MPDKFVSIQAQNGQIVTVSAAHAKNSRSKVLKDEPATDRFGVPLGPREKTSSATGGGSKSSKSSSGGNTTQVAASTPEEASK